jgi:predicted ATP-dependent endonuclease of OLD family
MASHALESFSIDGFRGLRKLELNDFGHVNIFLGGNNSGKTSVLEALSVVCNPFDLFAWVYMIRSRANAFRWPGFLGRP